MVALAVHLAELVLVQEVVRHDEPPLVARERQVVRAGVGAEISAQVMEHAFDYLDAPVKRLSGAEAPMPYARNLERLALPDVERIVKAVREVAYLE